MHHNRGIEHAYIYSNILLIRCQNRWCLIPKYIVTQASVETDYLLESRKKQHSFIYIDRFSVHISAVCYCLGGKTIGQICGEKFNHPCVLKLR